MGTVVPMSHRGLGPQHRRSQRDQMLAGDVQAGPNVQFLTSTHPVAAAPRRAKWEAAKPILVGDNVWLGGEVILCLGVSIGDAHRRRAGAVVTGDLPANGSLSPILPGSFARCDPRVIESGGGGPSGTGSGMLVAGRGPESLRCPRAVPGRPGPARRRRTP
jgi:hypothetical protein